MQRFVAEYAIDLNATQAAIRAGYSPHTAKSQGSRLLTNVDINAALVDVCAAAVAAVEEHTEESIGSAAWIIERAGEVVQRALNATPVRDAKGRIIEGEWTCNLSAATPALVLLAKRHPEFNDKREVSGPDGGPIQHDIRAIVALRDELKALVGAL